VKGKGSTSNKNPDPHQSDKLHPERIRIHINLQMKRQNVWNMGLFEHFFKGLGPYLEARIWIRIRIHITAEKSDQDPHPQLIKIRIRIK
jgi:hypothetical protein